MIFVTVGMHSQGFDRLIRKMDEIAGKIDEAVIMQIGHTRYKPKYAKYFDFVEDFQKIKELNKKARLVICHGGAGAIITALKQGTPLIAIPRLKRYREHNDDHQLELVDALAKEGKITTINDVRNLEKSIKSGHAYDRKGFNNEKTILIEKLRKYLIELKNNGILEDKL